MSKFLCTSVITIAALLFAIALIAPQFAIAQPGPPQPQPSADVTISDFTLSSNVFVEHDNITAAMTILNNGSAPAGNITLSLSQDFEEFWGMMGIAVGANSSVSIEHTWFAKRGNHNISAMLSVSGAALMNTRVTRSISVQTPNPPDLQITNVSISGDEVVEYKDVTATVTIFNNGSMIVSNISLMLYLDYEEIWNMTDISLDSNSYTNISHTWVAKKGYRSISAMLAISGAALMNTRVTRSISVQPPDLQITNVSITGDEFVEDKDITVTVMIFNNGSVAVSNISLMLYLDYEEIWNMTDISLDSNSYTNVSHTWVAEKGYHNVSAMLSINDMPLPSTRAGWNITVQAAPVGDVTTLVAALGVIVLAVFLPTLVQSLHRKRR
ncbi:MAG: hypothetical protein HZB92_00080 [Euryarchaeota archaeon]|nr:hypothetical protein [Euryarchaeota archaeon]